MISYAQIIVLAGRYLNLMSRAQRIAIYSFDDDRSSRAWKLCSSFSSKFAMLNLLTKSINTGGMPGL